MLSHTRAADRIRAHDPAGGIAPDVHDVQPAAELLASDEHNPADSRVREEGDVEVEILRRRDRASALDEYSPIAPDIRGAIARVGEEGRMRSVRTLTIFRHVWQLQRSRFQLRELCFLRCRQGR